jgi:hypothetical protein
MKIVAYFITIILLLVNIDIPPKLVMVVYVILTFSVLNSLISFSASHKLLKETREGKYKYLFWVFSIFEVITINRCEKLRKTIKEMDTAEKKTYKIMINSELDKKKNFAPLGIVLTISLTALFSFINLFMAYSSTWLNNVVSLSLNQRVKHLEEIGSSSGEISTSLLSDEFYIDPEYEELLKDVTNGFVRGDMGVYLQLLLWIIGCLIFYYIYYQFKYDRLAKLKYLFDEV